MPQKKKTKETIAPDKPQIIKAKLSEPQLKLLITDVALKPGGATYEDIAKRHGIDRKTLYDIRVERADEILELQNDFFLEHKADVMRALVESAKGFFTDGPKGKQQHPPNAKSIETFFELQQKIGLGGDTDPFRLFDIFWPLPKQARFIFEGDPTGQLSINLLISGIGYGKTQSLIPKMLTLARRNKGRQGMLVAPTYKMLNNPVLNYCIELMELCGTKYKHRKADGELELWGDTTIILRSCENEENLRGPNLAFVCGDELRNWTKKAFDISLGRIRDPKSNVREFAGVTTPYGFDWVYDLSENSSLGDLRGIDNFKVRTLFAKTEENIYLPPDFIDVVRERYDPQYAEQELEAKFLNVGKGLIYYPFNRSEHIKESVTYDPRLPVWIGQDFNVSPMATVLMQPHKKDNGKIDVHVFDELSIKNANIQDTIRELAEMGLAPGKNQITIYPDASGDNRSATSEKSSTQQLKDAGYEINSGRANPFIRDRYAAVNGKLKNANGDVSLFISPRCKKLIEDLEREVYKEGASIREGTRDGAKERGHHSDALGYAIHQEFNIESPYNYKFRSL